MTRAAWRDRASAVARSPEAWILVALAVIRLTGIGWGLPDADGWDNDGVAPRDFLPGLVDTFSPGHFYTYPPLHLAVLAVLTAPTVLAAVVRAPSLSPHDLVATFIQVPTMTALAYVARLASVAMSLGLTFAIGALAREVWGKRAGALALLTTGLSIPLTYYAHATCLDVPYLFWASLALLQIVRALVRGEPRRMRAAMVLAALAVATKDQAYALFLLSVPAIVVSARRVRGMVRETAVGLAVATGVLLLADGAVTNPSGFRRRVAFLLGSASQGYVQYADDWRGRGAVVVDLVKSFGAHYPWALLPFIASGLVLHVRATRGTRRVAGLVPLAAAASFTIAFNLTARRVEDRFAMPQMILAATYAAPALDAMLSGEGRGLQRGASYAAAALLLALGLFGCVEADAMLLFDPRYATEAFLRDQVAAGDVVETFGLDVYLPRFPPGARVERVGPEPVAGRSPLPDVDEIVGSYASAARRGARWMVIPNAWVWKYLPDSGVADGGGRVVPPLLADAMGDPEGTTFFRALFRGERGYRLVHESRYASRVLRRIDINASLGCPVFVFERVAP